ncbi:MAG: hypothetical protein UT63_C0023G0017 [Candidatus Gottesmanbacteria bacterium GW2011_GWC2_39_8]|uniref:Uncharacterized protein n=1 Tax=Candidatus Gottesmanbacteria bacterium GW2011_GWC2_39_8 TaxID=1618450 RepID=A0A0G0PYD9_9BACT|nr:MAG: hypothetical protein UT63_C0023G0017 [Candidatus Gottesmanbacteria bacterium GW2011_GWC2_39_8]
MKKYFLITVAIALLSAFIVSISADGAKDYQIKKINEETLQNGPYPWSTGTKTLKDRLSDIGLPALSSEGNVLHTHQHLDLIISGKNEKVPEEIGVGENDSFISAIHTHDDSGIIHIESNDKRNYTLGQFFDIWGVRFNDDCIGGYCTKGDKKLSVYVNGKPVKDNFQQIILESRQEIVIVYGSKEETPENVSSSYSFPPGF